jgi:hypothetical protein
MRINRGLLFWGLALVTAGAVALAVQAEAVPRDIVADAWRLWPLILIAIGVAIVFGRGPLGPLGAALGGVAVGVFAGALLTSIPFGFTSCGDAPMREGDTAEGSFDTGRAEVTLDLDCGQLDLSLQPGNAWDADLARAGGSPPRLDADDGSLSIETRGGPPFGERRHEWDVRLPRDVELDLEVDVDAAGSALNLAGGQLGTFELDMNAGAANLDLTSARVADLEIDMNAGSLSIETDAGTRLDGRIGFNAGAVDLCVPSGVALAIGLDDPNITLGHNLDEWGLERRGDTWTTPGLGTGTPSIRLTVDGNAASLTLNPEEGCR